MSRQTWMKPGKTYLNSFLRLSTPLKAHSECLVKLLYTCSLQSQLRRPDTNSRLTPDDVNTDFI